jgi:SAM-dependent methyltransferase
MDILREALGDIRGGRVLDVACGEGEFTRTLLHNLRSYAQIVGIDTLEYTRSRGSIFKKGSVRFVQMDAGRMGFAGGGFHTVSISSSLHHLDDIPRCLREILRVLEPGGVLIIRETHRDIEAEPQLTDMYLHHWAAQIDSALGSTHNPTFTRQEIVDLAGGLGLRDLKLYDIPNTDASPADRAAIRGCEQVIRRYMRHARRLPDHRALVRQGEALLRRLRSVGVQWEPELIIVGRKPLPSSEANSEP